MARLNAFDPVDYLVQRKFGPTARNADVEYHASISSRTPNPEFVTAVASYRAAIAALPHEERQALVEEEQSKQRTELATKLEAAEQARFFNRPSANADFSHWSKAACWTLEEAVALSLGKAPEQVRWETIRSYYTDSRFAQQYYRRRDLVARAKTCVQLYDPVLPGLFLAWAKRNGIDVVPELEAAVAKQGVQVADWKTLYDEQCESLRSCQETNEGLQRRISELESNSSPSQPREPRDEKALGTRERDSLLKLVIGMATKGYRYDPRATRTDVTTEIARDLEAAGVALDVDTVRKWLKQAADLMPPSETE